MQTFPDYPVSEGSKLSTEARLLEKHLGDGYTQSASDGINHLRDTYRAVFDVRLNAEIQEIVTFLRLHGGHTAFYYQVPREATSRRWRCANWTAPTRASATHSNLTATFVEDFGL